MGFQRVTKPRPIETVTMGRGNRITFSTSLLKTYDPTEARRVSVFIDQQRGFVGFSFHEHADLQISNVNQIRCDLVFRAFGITGDGTRLVAKVCDWADDVDCYIEVLDGR